MGTGLGCVYQDQMEAGHGPRIRVSGPDTCGYWYSSSRVSVDRIDPTSLPKHSLLLPSLRLGQLVGNQSYSWTLASTHNQSGCITW